MKCEKQLEEKIQQCKVVYSQSFEWKNEFVLLLSKDKKANNKLVKNKIKKQKNLQSPSIKASKKSEDIEIEGSIQQSHEELMDLENENKLSQQKAKPNESMDIEHAPESANKSSTANRSGNKKGKKSHKQTIQSHHDDKYNEENEKLKVLFDQYNKNNILYFQKLPRLLILIYQAYQNQFTIKIHSQELQLIYEYLSHLLVFLLKSSEIFENCNPSFEPKTKLDLEAILEIGDNLVCYNLEYARLNSYNNAINIWCQIAEKIIQTLPNPRKYFEQQNSLILPKDLNSENCVFSYNETNHILRIEYIHEKLIPDWKQKCMTLEICQLPQKFQNYIQNYFSLKEMQNSPQMPPAILQDLEISCKSTKRSIPSSPVQSNQALQPIRSKRSKHPNPIYPIFSKYEGNNEFEKQAVSIEQQQQQQQQYYQQQQQQSRDSGLKYCICFSTAVDYNPCSHMVQCSLCERWFHLTCLGLSLQWIKTIEHYFCKVCQKRYMFDLKCPNEQQTTGKKVERHQLFEMFERGKE